MASFADVAGIYDPQVSYDEWIARANLERRLGLRDLGFDDLGREYATNAGDGALQRIRQDLEVNRERLLSNQRLERRRQAVDFVTRMGTRGGAGVFARSRELLDNDYGRKFQDLDTASRRSQGDIINRKSDIFERFEVEDAARKNELKRGLDLKAKGAI